MESKMDQHQNQIETFEAFDDCENIGSNPAPDSPIGEIIEARYGRRALLGSAATLAALSAGLPRDAAAQSSVPVSGGPSTLTFSEPARALAQRALPGGLGAVLHHGPRHPEQARVWQHGADSERDRLASQWQVRV